MIIYICQDGTTPSGVASYGSCLLRAMPTAKILLLNCDSPPSHAAFGAAVESLPRNLSHDHRIVAQKLRRMVSHTSEPCTILPNTGETPWTATQLLLKELGNQGRAQVRVLGIVHSDVESQFAQATRYLAIAPVWIGVSRSCTEELRQRIGDIGGHVHQLPYPIEKTPDFARIATAPTSKPLRLAYVGRLEEPQKRISRLVAVLDRLAGLNVNFLATLAGDGPARSDLADRLKDTNEGVLRRVSIVGALDRVGVSEIWRTHEICLLTSAYEGMPIALLEAMSAGACPVVMNVKSGLPELLADRINARVVPQGDIDAMVAAIQDLAENRNEIIRLGSAARETVRARFSPEEHFANLNSIIHELWEFPPPSPASIPQDETGPALASIVAGLKEANQPVAVFGAGMFGRKVVDACLKAKLHVVALADSDPTLLGWGYRGLVCSGPEKLLSCSGCAIAIGSMHFSVEMRQRIAALAAERDVQVPCMVSYTT